MNLKQPTYNWYVIYTKTNGEKKIYKNLIIDQVECYLPLNKKLRQWSDRKKWIEEPFFRNYLFVKVSRIEFFNILKIPGVFHYVSFGGKPQIIPSEQINNIKKLIEQQEREVVLSHDKIERGQNAEVVFGLFKGMKGEVVKICGNYRLIIRIDALGCSIYVNILKDEIAVIPDKNLLHQDKPTEYII